MRYIFESWSCSVRANDRLKNSTLRRVSCARESAKSCSKREFSIENPIVRQQRARQSLRTIWQNRSICLQSRSERDRRSSFSQIDLRSINKLSVQRFEIERSSRTEKFAKSKYSNFSARIRSRAESIYLFYIANYLIIFFDYILN